MGSRGCTIPICSSPVLLLAPMSEYQPLLYTAFVTQLCTSVIDSDLAQSILAMTSVTHSLLRLLA